MRDQRTRETGSITVEASISLTFFTFVMVCLLLFINVGRAQMRIQLAANNAAREIAQYMYLMKITGLYSVEQGMSEAGGTAASAIGSAEDNFNNAVAAIDKISNKVQNIDLSDPAGAIGTIKDASSDLGTIKDSAVGLKNTISGVASNPIGFLKSMGALVASGLLNHVNNWVFGEIIGGALVEKYLGGDEANTLLKNLNVKTEDEGGGLDLSHCVILQNGNSANKSQDVNIVVIYEVKVFPLLSKNFTVRYAVSASARAWLGGDNLKVVKLVK